MKQRLLSTLLALTLVLCIGLTGTFAAAEGTPAAGKYTPGTYTATAHGFGGTVTVSMTFDADNVTDVTIDAKDETQTIGGVAAKALEAAVKEANGGEVDSVSGATVTSNAVKTAVADCIAQAKGEVLPAFECQMAPGTYTGSAWGYNHVQQLTAYVTVSETQILSVEVDMTNVHESAVKLQNSVDLMIPRIVEKQSVAVDAITGATATSNGIKGAITDALTQALVAGGSDARAISSFQTITEEAPKSETIETDVLVVGMGGSGSYASLRVAEQMYLRNPDAVSVLAIDKAGKYGGTTVFTGEALAVNPPKMMAERNNGEKYVDEEAFYQDWLNYTGGDAKPEMIRLMIDQSGNAIDWLDDNGFDFIAPEGGVSDGSNNVTDFIVKYKFGPLAEGSTHISKALLQSYFDNLFVRFTNYGGKYMLETEATELLYDAESNRVTGVMAYNKVTNTTYTIHAKSVILATGGFGSNGEMTTEYLSDEYYPLKGTWNVCGSLQNDGKMIQSAINIGAGTYNIGMTPVCHLFGSDGWLTNYPMIPVEGALTISGRKPAFWTEGDLPMMLCFWPKTFAVDSQGKRFISEDGLASFDAWKGGPNPSVIVTKAQVEEIAKNGIDVDDTSAFLQVNMEFLASKIPIPRGTVLPNAIQVMEDGVKAGFISKGDTIEELAVALGLDPETLKSELDKYNEACKTGVDEFGKAAENMVAMESGPYYAIHAGMYCYGTCAGLDIDEGFHVLKADGQTPIGGLYAVGADGQGVVYSEKKAYVTYGGADNGWGLMSGYVCGEQVVKDLYD